MNALTTLRIVFKKELIDALRDRRAMLTVLISAIAIGPLALSLLANFVSDIERTRDKHELMVAGIEQAPEFRNFLDRNNVTVKAPPRDFEAQLRTGKLKDAVVIVPFTFGRRMTARESPDIRLMYDDSRNEGQASMRRAEALVRGFERETILLRTLDRGIPARLMKPLQLDYVDLATSRQQGAFLLFLIPMFTLLGAVVGGLSVAIDVTAGERERGSLEPLLANPVHRLALVTGKWLCAFMHSATAVALSLTGFALTVRILASRPLGALLVFGAQEWTEFLLVGIPFAAFVTALQMAVATYGRSFKEAQTYANYIGLAINMVPLVSILAPMQDAFWQRLVPGLGQQMVLSRILRGDAVTPEDLLVPALVALACSSALLATIARLLGTEAIVFGRR